MFCAEFNILKFKVHPGKTLALVVHILRRKAIFGRSIFQVLATTWETLKIALDRQHYSDKRLRSELKRRRFIRCHFIFPASVIKN